MASASVARSGGSSPVRGQTAWGIERPAPRLDNCAGAAHPHNSGGAAVKRYLAALIAVAIALAASAGSAQALTFQRVCKSSFSTTDDGAFTTAAPYYIHITTRADSYIAAHAGLFEGRPVFNNPIRQVPCAVAESVAGKGMMAWENWAGDTGNVAVSTLDAPGRPYLGRFYCTGQSYESSGRTYETCTHSGTHVGTIAVQFVIK
jgi:hypothetical protein